MHVTKRYPHVPRRLRHQPTWTTKRRDPEDLVPTELLMLDAYRRTLWAMREKLSRFTTKPNWLSISAHQRSAFLVMQEAQKGKRR